METADEAGSYAGSGLGVLAPADALVNPVIGDTVSFGGNTSPRAARSQASRALYSTTPHPALEGTSVVLSGVSGGQDTYLSAAGATGEHTSAFPALGEAGAGAQAASGLQQAASLASHFEQPPRGDWTGGVPRGGSPAVSRVEAGEHGRCAEAGGALLASARSAGGAADAAAALRPSTSGTDPGGVAARRAARASRESQYLGGGPPSPSLSRAQDNLGASPLTSTLAVARGGRLEGAGSPGPGGEQAGGAPERALMPDGEAAPGRRAFEPGHDQRAETPGGGVNDAGSPAPGEGREGERGGEGEPEVLLQAQMSVVYGARGGPRRHGSVGSWARPPAGLHRQLAWPGSTDGQVGDVGEYGAGGVGGVGALEATAASAPVPGRDRGAAAPADAASDGEGAGSAALSPLTAPGTEAGAGWDGMRVDGEARGGGGGGALAPASPAAAQLRSGGSGSAGTQPSERGPWHGEAGGGAGEGTACDHGSPAADEGEATASRLGTCGGVLRPQAFEVVQTGESRGAGAEGERAGGPGDRAAAAAAAEKEASPAPPRAGAAKQRSLATAQATILMGRSASTVTTAAAGAPHEPRPQTSVTVHSRADTGPSAAVFVGDNGMATSAQQEGAGAEEEGPASGAAPATGRDGAIPDQQHRPPSPATSLALDTRARRAAARKAVSSAGPQSSGVEHGAGSRLSQVTAPAAEPSPKRRRASARHAGHS
ncbi:hypothetical protein ACKKBF_B33345 [Auxenochlorella protothecoides x Auxenochlorella symbiontica]